MSYKNRLKKVIPGGAHTYSRGSDQFPSNAPEILEKGKGAYIWDANGNKYLDYGMALRAVTVGYAYDPIVKAAMEQASYGNNLTRPSVVELKAAELFCETITSADMVKFAKNGSNVTTAAIKLARAYNGKKYVAICAQHPFFSFDDWFISSTPLKRGIPEEYSTLTLKFNYNEIMSLEELFNKYNGQISAVILEPATTVGPENNFLHKVKELCKKNDSVFILDEMITGFRFDLQGAQKYFDIEPDLCTFGKGMANGFSVAAVAGKREIMELGGIDKVGLERTFLLSTTHGAEMSGLGAFVKTVEIYKQLNVIEHLWDYGKKLKTGINEIAKSYGLEKYFYVEGFDCSPNYVVKDLSGDVSLELRTLFSQEMIKNKVLMPWIALCYEHQEKELTFTLNAVEKSLFVIKQALEGDIEIYLDGPPIKPVFRKKN